MSRSRFGGFRKGKKRYFENWSTMRSETVNTPETVQDLDHSKAKGIWNLRSTTQFPKKDIVDNGLVLHLDSSNPTSYPGSGSTWYDLSNSNLNMTVNSSYISSIGLSSGTSATTATTSILNTDVHSIFFLLKLETNGTYPNHVSGAWNKILSYNAGGSDRTPSVWRYPSNKILHWRYDPSNTGTDFNATNTASVSPTGSEFALNTWYFVGVTKNGSTARSYVNGSPLGNNTVSNPKTSGTAPIILWESYAPPAKLNCLHIYNRVLTDSEVLYNYDVIKKRFGL